LILNVKFHPSDVRGDQKRPICHNRQAAHQRRIGFGAHAGSWKNATGKDMMSDRKNAALMQRHDISDDDLMELVQRRTFDYFWDYAHPASGMARDRGGENDSGENILIALGASGGAVMAIIIAVERQWIERQEALQRLSQMLAFLESADCYRGAFPHYLNA
jgi:hypothetical protein